MEFVHLIWLGGGLAAVAAGWVWVAWRGGRHLNDRMSEQVSRSAALARECATTLGFDTASGSLSSR
jgi:hypothetical protein